MDSRTTTPGETLPNHMAATSITSGQRWRALMLLVAMLIACLGSLPRSVADEPKSDDSNTGPVETPLAAEDFEHWAFQPLRRPPLPRHIERTVAHPIDRFVQASLVTKGLSLQPPAPFTTLQRRLTFVLTGMPAAPQLAGTPARLSQDQRYLRLVDRLLSSPRYGERWAQHWLDLARFAETDGFEHDKIRPQAWRYRDWVVRALNRDMPYDEFVKQQLAGDEFHPNKQDAQIATAFCMSGPDMPDINSQVERRDSLLNELTGTVGAVFLGLQVGCAQCHDHKYDPISQHDFYRLRSVFEPAVRVTKNRSIFTLANQRKAEPSRLMIRGDWRRPGPVVMPGAPRIASVSTSTISKSTAAKPVWPQLQTSSQGRRKQLANWLFDDARDLTARVIVNRVWQHHFGVGLVDTPSDFGVMGSEPSHPELLDWLACYLIENRWSLKSLHRLIVTSATFRQRSRWQGTDAAAANRAQWQAAIKHDPKGELLSRYRRRRLDGEAIRDAMLAAAGVLNPQMYGPGIRPPLPTEIQKTLLRNHWPVTKDASQHDRRSLYVFARRNLRYPVFDVFDRPDGNASCAQRGRSTTAPQSLHLLNSKFTFDIATRCAHSVMIELGDEVTKPEAKIDWDRIIRTMVTRCWSRPPLERELNLLRRFVSQSQLGMEEKLVDLATALFNANEFVYVD